MTELEQRALLGDKQAQQECTDKGIVLPCPFCEAELIPSDEEGWLSHPKSECQLEGLSIDIQKRLRDWNTRPAPPIGHCKDCGRWKNETCQLLIPMNSGTDFCSKFK